MRKTTAIGVVLGLTAAVQAERASTDYVLQSLDRSIGLAYEDLSYSYGRGNVTEVDISGIESNDGLGADINETLDVLLVPNAHITGIGWETTQEAFAPSWLSEMTIEMTDSALTDGVSLAPGAGDDVSGAFDYASLIVDLVADGLDFTLGGDGTLRMEFWESFDDFPGAADGVYLPTVSESKILIQWVPEPTSFGLLAIGVLGLLRRR